MADRRVNTTGKDKGGDIIMLCNSDEYWLFEHKNEAIQHIEKGVHSYYVSEAGYRSEIHVYTDKDGRKRLATSAGGSSANNLENLPDY